MKMIIKKGADADACHPGRRPTPTRSWGHCAQCARFRLVVFRHEPREVAKVFLKFVIAPLTVALLSSPH
jgi:hypothetical protein